MTLLENGKPFCPVLSIQDANRSEFVVVFGSRVPLSENSMFYVTTPSQPMTGLGMKHSIEFPDEKKLWSIQINSTSKSGKNFVSTVVFLGQSDL